MTRDIFMKDEPRQDDVPEDPLPRMIVEIDQIIANSREIARMNKGLYDSYIEAGFNKCQALYLVGCMTTGKPGESP
jgi:hypothetical protein